ncbi:MAG: beta-phosphoglucomutase [Chloroflexota bacterium]|nr:beta-phosphoglucomutase [Chloroflexota bacterium]
MPSTLRALIFDLDGVITDTVELHFKSWVRLAEEVGLTTPLDFRDRLRGVSRRETLRRLLDGQAIEETQAQEWMRLKNMYYLAHIAYLTPADLLPGVLALLDDAQADGLKLAVASSSMNAKFVLKQLGLFERMDAIADATMIPRTKPEPDLFIWAAGRLGVLPDEAIVFEDAEDGVRAALNAGFQVVGLGPANVGAAHLVLPGLDAIRLAELRARLGW